MMIEEMAPDFPAPKKVDEIVRKDNTKHHWNYGINLNGEKSGFSGKVIEKYLQFKNLGNCVSIFEK
jgi:hypothetical protein